MFSAEDNFTLIASFLHINSMFKRLARGGMANATGRTGAPVFNFPIKSTQILFKNSYRLIITPKTPNSVSRYFLVKNNLKPASSWTP